MKNQFPDLPKEKFVLVNENKPLRDKELVTKPRGFFADAMYRFSRNKGSIVGAVVIGILVLYAIIAPLSTPYSVSYNDGYYRYTLPKLFTSENIDFLDGCQNKTLNEQAFLYYYAMGAESGHNAIKRQEYSREENAQGQMMYSFRLDTYQSPGQIFLTGVTQEAYEAIQDYQDKNEVQIVYPTTDLSKRPAAPQDKTNANYWFETELGDGNMTRIANYTENEDGSFTFQNIYSPYVTPTLKSGQTFANAKKVRLDEKEGKYTMAFLMESFDENGDSLGFDDSYFSIFLENDKAVVTATSEASEASLFAYDDTNKTMLVEISGHDDPTLDGDYFFGLPAARDSAVQILPAAELSGDDYIPFRFYDNQTKESASITDKGEYYFCAARPNTTQVGRFLAGDALGAILSVKTSASAAGKLTFVKNSADELIINIGDNKFPSYLTISADGNENKLGKNSSVDDGSAWHFDNVRQSIYTTVNGHADSGLDGDYYFALNENEDALLLIKESDIVSSTNLIQLFSGATQLATSFEAGSYYLGRLTTSTTYKYYYATGGFNGDNYTSKMRVEGEDNYLYSYARPTEGTYELRVNYYEYYRYYHAAVLKDGISEPFFLFGTTNTGQDIFVCLASGARFSFIMAIVVAAVNMIVGAIYGAIEGYYGGKIDLVMERIVEILSAVPFMIVITLLKYHMGGSSQVLILFIAFFLTGWIGESGTVRMQFYRFKNQEYVLAARTLGAKDWRIMFRHIFPNSLGTIVTGSVLVIPGMIFSETSLSYLGIINLNSGSLTSVGTLLATGQPYLITYPHMILFPAIFISLLMLCFNLFGNGLRDAFNPSLRGTED